MCLISRTCSRITSLERSAPENAALGSQRLPRGGRRQRTWPGIARGFLNKASARERGRGRQRLPKGGQRQGTRPGAIEKCFSKKKVLKRTVVISRLSTMLQLFVLCSSEAGQRRKLSEFRCPRRLLIYPAGLNFIREFCASHSGDAWNYAGSAPIRAPLGARRPMCRIA